MLRFSPIPIEIFDGDGTNVRLHHIVEHRPGQSSLNRSVSDIKCAADLIGRDVFD